MGEEGGVGGGGGGVAAINGAVSTRRLPYGTCTFTVSGRIPKERWKSNRTKTSSRHFDIHTLDAIPHNYH